MAITVKDSHGTFTKKRRRQGPALDRRTVRYFAVVENVWSRGYATRRDAESAEREMKSRAEHGVGLHRQAMTFGEFLNTVWLPLVDAKVARGQMKRTTAGHYSILVETHVRPALGAVRLRDLRAATLRCLYADLASKRKLSPKSVRNVHVLISNALSLAVSDGYLPSNPAKAREVAPTARSREMTAWEPDEVRTFLSCARDDRLFAAWRLLATCGLRRGEVLGLRWTDLNVSASTLSVNRSLVADPKSRDLVWQTPKTERSRRTIDLDAATVTALKSHRKQQASERLAAMGAFPDGGDLAADLVFADKAGQPIRPATFSRQFNALVRRAEVTRIRLHDLRHTAATLLLRAGVPVHVVSERLGHASTSITMDVYAHSLRDQRSGAADAIASAIDL